MYIYILKKLYALYKLKKSLCLKLEPETPYFLKILKTFFYFFFKNTSFENKFLAVNLFN